MSTSAHASPTTKEGLRHRTAKTGSEDSSCSPIAELDADMREQEAFERELLAIWLESKSEASQITIPFCGFRSETWSHFRAIFRLLRKPRFTVPIIRRFTKGIEARLLGLFVGNLLIEFIPLFKAYLNWVLLDLVLSGFASESRTWVRVVGVAALDLLLRSLEEVIESMHGKNQSIIRVSWHSPYTNWAARSSVTSRVRTSPFVSAFLTFTSFEDCLTPHI